MEDLTKKPLVDIIKEMTKLDYDINMKLLQYELLRREVIRRYPTQDVINTFKPKQKKIGSDING